MWKCKPWKWLWGLLPLAFIALMVNWGERGNIERDLAERSKASLDEAGLSWVEPRFEGRDGILVGTSFDAAEKDVAAAIVQDKWGVRIVDDRTTLENVVSPYNWSARREGRRVVLSGNVPSEKKRDDILRMVRDSMPSHRIVDRMTQARSSLDTRNWMKGVGFGIRQLAELKTGAASLRDDKLSVTGVAGDYAGYNRVTKALRGRVPQGTRVVRQAIKPPPITSAPTNYTFPYRWSAEKRVRELRLSGHIPSQTARTRVVATARKLFRNRRLADRMVVASGDPRTSRWLGGIDYGLKRLSQLKSGTVTLEENDFSIEGVADKFRNYANVTKALKTMPKGFGLFSERITAPAVSPYVWSAARRGGHVRLSGYVHDEAERKRVMDRARRELPGVRIIDGMKIASGGPERGKWLDGIGYSLAQLSRLRSGTTSLTDNSHSIDGATETQQNYRAARSGLNTLPSGYQIATARIAPPEVAKYVWSATRENGVLRLSGYVHDETERQQVLDRARRIFPGLRLADNMQYATGGPGKSKWLDGIDYSLDQLARLKSGTASLENSDFSIIGPAVSQRKYADAKDLLRDLPSGFSLGREMITPPDVTSYVWSAEREGRTVRLSGFVHDEAERRRVLSNARRAMPRQRIVDNMQYAVGGPPKPAWLDGINYSLARLSQLKTGQTRLEDRNFSISGEAPTHQKFTALTDALTTMPGGYSLKSELITPPRRSPYLWSADHRNGRVKLSGYVHDKTVRRAVVDKTRRALPGVRVVDEMQFGSGGPNRKRWLDGVDFGLGQLRRLKTGTAALADTEYSIRGEALRIKDYNEVRRNAKSPPSGYRLANENVTPPFRKNHQWSAERKNGRVVLSGQVRNEKARRKVIAIARSALPNKKIVDNMRIASGGVDEDKWHGGIKYGLGQLSRLRNGSVSLDERSYSIEGEAVTTRKYSDVLAELKTLPAGFGRGQEDVRPPRVDPYVWRADHHAGSLTLSGHVPSDKVRRRMINKARQLYPGARIVDRMEVASGQPDNWFRAASNGLTQLSRLDRGNSSTWNNDLDVRGWAATQAIKDRASNAMNTLTPENFNVRDLIRVTAPTAIEEPKREPEPRAPMANLTEQCQTELNSVLSRGSIRFGSASSKIEQRSFPMLNELAEIANRCPNTRIEVGGHTDSSGSKKFNQVLSRKRARAVVDFLIKEGGVRRNRLTAIGYGEDKPLVPNNSEANKAKNRRIEFVVSER